MGAYTPYLPETGNRYPEVSDLGKNFVLIVNCEQSQLNLLDHGNEYLEKKREKRQNFQLFGKFV